MGKLTHLDQQGAAHMVDVTAKPVTAREAQAEALIALSAEAYNAVMSGDTAKGDVLAAARLAGIMAAKKTPDLIPLCHPIPLSKAAIDIVGVEMEALTSAAVAALTIYDMVKAIDRSAIIESVKLLSKSGGKSGTWHRAPGKPRSRKP
jgi:cyclic pyranopterin phosphate synthase